MYCVQWIPSSNPTYSGVSCDSPIQPGVNGNRMAAWELPRQDPKEPGVLSGDKEGLVVLREGGLESQVPGVGEESLTVRVCACVCSCVLPRGYQGGGV